MPVAVIVASAHAWIIGAGDDARAVKIRPFRPSGQIQRVQTIHVNRSWFLRLDHEVNSQTDWINNRGAGDADFRRDIGRADVSIGNRSDPRARIDETGL